MISSLVARASAGVLAAMSLPLLFASDVVLPHLAAGLPATASWVGQLLAASWLSVAVFNWTSRDTILGGIYGRPAVNLNLLMDVVSALTLLKAGQAAPGLRICAVPFVLMAGVYGLLLLRGPLDRPGSR